MGEGSGIKLFSHWEGQRAAENHEFLKEFKRFFLKIMR